MGPMADTAVQYDPFSPEFLEDPYPTLAAIRESGELVRDPIGIYLITRYDDVWSLLRDKRVGRDLPFELTRIVAGDGKAVERFFTTSMINYEGREHTRMRLLMSKPFTPGRIRQLEDRTAALVGEMLDGLDDRFDLAADFSLVLPVLVICDLLGIPREDREYIKPWANALAQNPSTPEARLAVEDALENFRGYFEEMVAGRRPYDRNGLFGALLAAEEDGQRLSHDEVIENTAFLFFAGHETTTNLIANGALALIRNPDQRQRLRQHPGLVATAVEEMLRYDSPVQSQPRITHEPIELSCGTLKAGRVISLSFAAANRDPRQFVDPETFDVGRTDNHHVGFGNGTHFCLGAHLARLETRLAFDAFVRRFETLELDGDYVRKPTAGLRGLSSLPVRVTRR